MSSETIRNVAYDNYDDFEHVNFIFSQNFISLFWGLFNDETDLRVMVVFRFQCVQQAIQNTSKLWTGYNSFLGEMCKVGIAHGSRLWIGLGDQ
jgi:hypothetical protein